LQAFVCFYVRSSVLEIGLQKILPGILNYKGFEPFLSDVHTLMCLAHKNIIEKFRLRYRILNYIC